ncbi:MAG: ABC transporter substrate-binding protein [Candidatus Staskawiczbacteria bacterium]|nr:ABC transporter substrate-binding protein [Candidatus Staskawiczbacteria bacterium]
MVFPSFSQWKQFFKVLGKTERIFFLVLVILALVSGTYLATVFYINNTKVVPAYKGNYIEGVVGQPRFINPIYGEANDVDRGLIDLVYSGLMTYDKNGNIINDLIDSYQISEDSRAYTFKLKDNLLWQDGVPLTTDDIIYTIKTIQDSEYKSPLRANWLDVSAEKISENSFSLALNSPYNSFLENLTVKILPQHIWKTVIPQNFALSSYNLQAVGSGPYTISSIEQTNAGFIKSITLSANRKYYEKVPYISNISFQFFENKNDLIKAANQKTIDGFSVSSLDETDSSMGTQIKQGWGQNEKFNSYSFSMPRYFAVFFNTDKSKILSDKNITQALNYSVNKQELVQTISGTSNDSISVVDSPILPNYFNYAQPTVVYEFNTDTAKTLLDKAGYKEQEDGQRSKPNDKKPAFQFKSYLKIGSSGNEVTELQGCLARLDPAFNDLLQSETGGKYGEGTGEAVNEFQIKYLPDAKPTAEVGPGTRAKLNELCLKKEDNSILLKFTLTTINQPQLVQTANLLKDYWQKVGVTVDLQIAEISDLKDIIKNRSYDALLYGEALSNSPDLYPFWHSTQINDPGINLSSYQNKDVDQLLKSARETLDQTVKQQDYEKLQDLILADTPALFLYNPDYIYWVSNKINGIDTIKIVDPAKRFENISNWYINTRRVWK